MCNQVIINLLRKYGDKVNGRGNSFCFSKNPNNIMVFSFPNSSHNIVNK